MSRDQTTDILAEPPYRRRVIRSMIRDLGGMFHGPHVEHLSMEEEAFWNLINQVIAAARMDSKL